MAGSKHAITRIETMCDDDVCYLENESVRFSCDSRTSLARGLQLMARRIQIAYKLTVAF